MCSKKPYRSCIKINGVPILPPLITPKIRNEIKKYKEKAIEIEAKQQRDKIFRQYIEEIEKLQELTKIELPQLEIIDSDSPDLFSSLNTVVEAPNSPKLIKTLENQLTFSPTNEVSQNSTNRGNNLTRETIDVSEYTDEGMKVITETESCNSLELDQTVSLNISTDSKESDVRPRLTRSNSYTLEAPSPILLAHLQKEQEKANEIEISTDKIRRLSLDNNDNTPILRTSSNNEKLSPRTHQKVFETDITVQKITIKTPMDDNEKPENLEPHVLEIIKKLPINCTQQILEILEKQKLGKIDAINNKFIDFQPKDKEASTPLINHSTSTDQSLYYTVMESLSNNENEKGGVEPIGTRGRSLSPKKLFKRHSQQDLKDEAASIIGAAVRGYLIRRLIKTERVQSLIRTVKDVVLCAVQLEKSDSLDEYDIELHRRLINQLDATLYAFHDIFFKLSKREQMSIIALDRQRKLKKTKEALSRSSSARSSDSSFKQRSRSNSKSSGKIKIFQ